MIRHVLPALRNPCSGTWQSKIRNEPRDDPSEEQQRAYGSPAKERTCNDRINNLPQRIAGPRRSRRQGPGLLASLTFRIESRAVIDKTWSHEQQDDRDRGQIGRHVAPPSLIDRMGNVPRLHLAQARSALPCPNGRSGAWSQKNRSAERSATGRDRNLGPRLVHMPSEPSGFQRSRTVSNGTSFAQATDAILGKQALGRTLIRMSYALSAGVDSSSGRGAISGHRQPSPAPQAGEIGWCGRCGWHGRSAGARHGVDGRCCRGGRVRRGG
jgi:hypothetical protein